MAQGIGSPRAFFSIDGVSLNFGGLKALTDVTFTVEEKSIFSIIGPNGSGKTTLFNLIGGLYKPDGGRIIFQGKEISGLAPYRIARLGIARTFQNIELFSGGSVMDNLLLGRHIHMRTGIFSGAFMWGRRSRAARDEIRNREIAETIMEFLGVSALRDRSVASLPYGKRKLIELGRALALEPELLLLDEPAAGMFAEEKKSLHARIREVRDQFNTTILLIEHDMGTVMGLSDAVLAIDQGRVIAHGKPHEVQNHPDVIRAYLGS